MNWDAVGAIGEIVGAAVVVVTLAYLAIQVRHARDEARRALSQGRGEALRSLIEQQVDPKINALSVETNRALGAEPYDFAATLSERTGLSPEDAMLLMWNQIAWWNYFVQIFPKVDELSPMERMQFEVPIRAMYGRPGLPRLFYQTYVREVGHPDALRYIEGVLGESS